MAPDIEAVLFDMGGTLRGTVKRSRAERLAYTAEILKLLGSDADPDRFARLLARRSTAYRRWARATLLELDEPELWARWLLPDWPAEQVRPLALQLNRLWRQATGERNMFPESAEVILALFRRGYRLALVSNTTCSAEAPEALEKLGLTGYFETIILSSVVGIRKPDPAILLEATTRMGIAPEKCAYVGDLPHRDVISARQAGFSQTVIIRRRRTRESAPAGDPQLQPDHAIRDLRELLEIFPARTTPARTPPPPGPRFEASVSTMWGVKNFHTLGDFAEAARRIGFARIELNHAVDTPMLEAARLLAGARIEPQRVSSVHEPCPADISAAELKKRDWLISSPDEDCRRQGVQSIRRSIDLARRLGAGVVVVHSGSVHPNRAYEERLRQLLSAGQNSLPEAAEAQAALNAGEMQASPEALAALGLPGSGTLKDAGSEARELHAALIALRQQAAPAGLRALKHSLAELLDYAAGSGVRLGLENRYHYLEFPSPDELEELLNMAGPDQLGFIYDVGHAQALDRLGFFPHDEWLKRFGGRVIGVHLHDVTGFQDHHLPGLGQVDFARLAPYWPAGALRTLEFQGYHTHEQVQNSLKFLRQHGCIR